MISKQDEKWLKKTLKDSFGNSKHKVNKNKKSLEGFSMLVRNMVKNMEDNLDKTKALWEKDPASEELRERFELLTRCLFYLERYCREKIERELPKKNKMMIEKER